MFDIVWGNLERSGGASKVHSPGGSKLSPVPHGWLNLTNFQYTQLSHFLKEKEGSESSGDCVWLWEVKMATLGTALLGGLMGKTEAEKMFRPW